MRLDPGRAERNIYLMPSPMSTMFKGFSIVLLGLISLHCAASTMTVQTDRDRQDFKGYRTFAWRDGTGKDVPENLDRIVRREVERELLAKGYVKADGGKADLLVTYHGTIDERAVWQPVRQGQYGMTVRPMTVREGTLLLEFIDSAKGQTVWVGSAQDDVGAKITGEKIPRAVGLILKNFPQR